MLLVELEEFLSVDHPVVLFISLPHELQRLLTYSATTTSPLPLMGLQHHGLNLLKVQKVIVIEVQTVEESIENFFEIIVFDCIELGGSYGGASLNCI